MTIEELIDGAKRLMPCHFYQPLGWYCRRQAHPFDEPGELERIRMWHPETAAEIDSIVQDVKDARWKAPHCTWGHRSGGKSANRGRVGALCSSCESRTEN